MARIPVSAASDKIKYICVGTRPAELYMIKSK